MERLRASRSGQWQFVRQRRRVNEEETSMTSNVCPADTVHASVERVWELLMQPAGYGRFWDFTVERVEPEGSAMVGQKIVGWSRALGRRWRSNGEIREVDAERHQILFRMSYPFGVVGNNRIVYAQIDEQSCMLRFG
jgi:hypothetical protein